MYFKQFETLSQTTIDKLWSIVNNSSPDDWFRERSDVEWRVRIPVSVFEENPKTHALINEFVHPSRLYIQRLEPKTSYFWHLDYDRFASMSVGLNCFDNSYTLFGDRSNKSMGPGHIPGIEPLIYKPSTMYLFNGNKWHCGINFSDEMRYVVSISFTMPTRIENAIAFLKENFPDDGDVAQ